MTVRARRALASLSVLAAGVVGGGILLGLAPVSVVPAAGAATCTTSGGVSVVVDYRELGGSTITACAPDGGGKSAAAIFASVGVDISYATRQPGFVCRVNGAPASDPCVNSSPSNAYWGLWWADGSSATWTYSSSGVGSLTVAAGGSVGWSWQQDRAAGTSVPPAVAPPVSRSSTATSSPTPTSSATPTPSPTASPTGGGGTTQPSATTSPSPSPTPGGSGSSAGGSGSAGDNGSPTANPTSGSASPSPSPSPLPSPGASGSASPTPRATPSSDSPSDSGARDDGRKGPPASESPGDSSASDGGSEGALGSESPNDSGATDSSPTSRAARAEPQRIPTWMTWTVVGLLAIAIVVSAAVARRRRGV